MIGRTLRLAGLLGAVALAGCGGTVGEAEIARRVEASVPTWQSYPEDIKAQVGAGPVAEWEGTVDEVRVEPEAIRVTFRLEGPWAARDAAMPLLLNEPFGGVRRNSAAERQGDRVTYLFDNAGREAAVPVPWVELKFPGGERRIVLSQEGTWKNPAQ